jgi:acetate kinase
MGSGAVSAQDVLVVNVGSSSIKLRVLDGHNAVIAERDLPAGDDATLAQAIAGFGETSLVGHRIVHGGSRYAYAISVDDEVRSALGELVALAPLHQPAALTALDIARNALPRARHVACFDTAFHATLPAFAVTYAIPAAWRDDLGVRRYGFHGLSHAYAARRGAALLERGLAGSRVVTCHLGAGASLCAVRDGYAVDTTMGFTPLEGLVMATRSGDLDPGLIVWLLRHQGMEPDVLEDALERRSGLLGMAGTADMRVVLSQAAEGSPTAQLALDVYAHRLRKSIAAMTASLAGLDVLVFTGGVGERSPAVRERATAGLGYLGVTVEAERNEAAIGGEDCDISDSAAKVRTLVVRAREDIEIARQTRLASHESEGRGCG